MCAAGQLFLTYSSQREIPEDVNKRVVDELKQVFRDKIFPA